MGIAYAHLGNTTEPIATADLLWMWTLDPTFLVPLAVALLYLVGWRRMGASARRRFGRWRPVALLTGTVAVGIALLSPIDILSDRSFIWHMIQHELIMKFGVPMMLLSAPFVPVVRGLPERVRQRVFVPMAQHPLVRRVVLTLISPLAGFMAYVLVILAWHVPEMYDLALRSAFWHYMEHASFVFGAALYWWNLITPYPFGNRLNVLLRMVMAFGSTIPNSALGATLTFSSEVLYGYRALDGFWGMTMLEDQRVGGVLMWAMGGMVPLATMTLTFLIYAAGEERREPHHQAQPATARAG